MYVTAKFMCSRKIQYNNFLNVQYFPALIMQAPQSINHFMFIKSWMTRKPWSVVDWSKKVVS